MFKASMNIILKNILSITVCICAVMVLVLASNSHAASCASCSNTAMPSLRLTNSLI